jgi:tetratricopeptide (TPR) repeat protein
MFTDPEKLYQHLVLDPSEIRKFVKETPESLILDYKSWSSLKKPAAGTGEKRLSNIVCSFANTGGGVILFGVCDSPRKLEKHEFSEAEIENLQNVLSRQANPPVWFAKHQTVDVGENSEVLLLFVPASRHIHQVREDMCIYVRRASTSRKADIHEIGALYADRPQLVQLTKGIEEAGKNLPDTTGHFTQGVALREEHEYGQAIAEFNECIRLNQSNTEAYIQRGFTRACLGDFDGAMADIDRAIEIDPRNAGAYSTRGYLYGDVGDFESAEEADTKVIEILPDNAEGYHNRAIVRDAMGGRLNSQLMMRLTISGKVAKTLLWHIADNFLKRSLSISGKVLLRISTRS